MEQFRRRRSQVGLLCSAFLADGCLLPPVLALRHLRGCRFFSFFAAGGVSLRSFVFRVFALFFAAAARTRTLARLRSARKSRAIRFADVTRLACFALRSLACSRARRALRSQVSRHPLRGCHSPCLLRACFARFALRFAPHIRRRRRRRAGGRKRRNT